jgi:ArsR family transcriptional regulator, arsenate/arsenite/antimonite-responsive transcriptional repressor
VAGSKPVELIATSEAARTEARLDLLSAVADPVRWAVLRHLGERGESCVCDLQERIPVAANLLSYHLKVLREADLVTTRRRGRWVDYSLAQGTAERLLDALPVTPEGRSS